MSPEQSGISTQHLIQIGGIIVSFGVMVEKMMSLVRDWRGGSPELRLIKQQLVEGNKIIRTILEGIARRQGGR
jgi:hypothetical protein